MPRLCLHVFKTCGDIYPGHAKGSPKLDHNCKPKTETVIPKGGYCRDGTLRAGDDRHECGCRLLPGAGRFLKQVWFCSWFSFLGSPRVLPCGQPWGKTRGEPKKESQEQNQTCFRKRPAPGSSRHRQYWQKSPTRSAPSPS